MILDLIIKNIGVGCKFHEIKIDINESVDLEK